MSHLSSAYNLLNVEGEATTLPFRLRNRYQPVGLLLFSFIRVLQILTPGGSIPGAKPASP